MRQRRRLGLDPLGQHQSEGLLQQSHGALGEPLPERLFGDRAVAQQTQQDRPPTERDDTLRHQQEGRLDKEQRSNRLGLSSHEARFPRARFERLRGKPALELIQTRV